MTGETTDGAESGGVGQSVDLRRVANLVGLVLLIAVVLPFIVYAVPQLIGAQHSYVVLSASMEPTISPGDVVFVDGVKPTAIERGDVITFTKGNDAHPTTHRVIGIQRSDGQLAFKTKGDNNEDPDQTLVSPSELEGRVMTLGGSLLVIPYIGYIIQFAGTQTGYVLLIAVPIVLLVISEIWGIVKESRGDGQSAADDSAAEQPDEWTAPSADATAADRSGRATEIADYELSPVTEDDESSGVSFGATELQLGLVVLGVFAVYSIWVAYNNTAMWSVGVAASVLVTACLLGTLYFFGGSAGDDEPWSATDGGRPSVPVAERPLAHEANTGTRQPVEEFDTLVEVADAMKRPIYRDPTETIQYVTGPASVFVHDGTPGDEWAFDELPDEPDESTGEGGAADD